jgi:hypothetical protein
MKIPLAIGVSLAVLLAFGCKDREAEARKAKDESEAKARAAAARKEMAVLPKVFQTPNYFRKNEPARIAEPAPRPEKATP